MEPIAYSPLSQDELLAVPYDNCDTFGLEPYKYAEHKPFYPITYAQDELKFAVFYKYSGLY